MYKVNNF